MNNKKSDWGMVAVAVGLFAATWMWQTRAGGVGGPPRPPNYYYVGTVHGDLPNAYWGTRLTAIPDVSNDGFDDFVFSGRQDDYGRHIHCHSESILGQPVWETVVPSAGGAGEIREFGSAGDVNADGKKDVYALLWDSTNYSALSYHALSGSNGVILYTLEPVDATDATHLGDVNGDAQQDVAIGFPLSDRVEIYSLYNLIRVIVLPPPPVPQVRRFGDQVASGTAPAGEPERLFISAPTEDDDADPANGCGAIYCYNPTTGQQIYRISHQGVYRLGRALWELRDLDGDGYGDFAATNGGQTDTLLVFSGRTGAFLHRTSAGSDEIFYAHFVAPGPDVTGDGVPDYAVLASHLADSGGRVRILSGASGKTVQMFAFSNSGERPGSAAFRAARPLPDSYFMIGMSGLDGPAGVDTGGWKTYLR